MPLIEEVEDEGSPMVKQDDEPELEDLLKQLTIPPEYNRPEYLSENPVPALETWKRKTIAVLEDIQRIVKLQDTQVLDAEARADIAFAVVPFAPNRGGSDLDHDPAPPREEWVEERAQTLAQGPLDAGHDFRCSCLLRCNLQRFSRCPGCPLHWSLSGRCSRTISNRSLKQVRIRI